MSYYTLRTDIQYCTFSWTRNYPAHWQDKITHTASTVDSNVWIQGALVWRLHGNSGLKNWYNGPIRAKTCLCATVWPSIASYPPPEVTLDIGTQSQYTGSDIKKLDIAESNNKFKSVGELNSSLSQGVELELWDLVCIVFFDWFVSLMSFYIILFVLSAPVFFWAQVLVLRLTLCPDGDVTLTWANQTLWHLLWNISTCLKVIQTLFFTWLAQALDHGSLPLGWFHIGGRTHLSPVKLWLNKKKISFWWVH